MNLQGIKAWLYDDKNPLVIARAHWSTDEKISNPIKSSEMSKILQDLGILRSMFNHPTGIPAYSVYDIDDYFYICCGTQVYFLHKSNTWDIDHETQKKAIEKFYKTVF